MISVAFWPRVCGVNIVANASSVMFLGSPQVTEMGRCREKKEERARTISEGVVLAEMCAIRSQHGTR